MSFIIQEIPAPTVFGIGNVTGVAANNIVSFEVGTQDTLIYESTAQGDWVLDVVFDPTTSLNVAMQDDDIANIRFGALVGGTPYKQLGLTIDGTASGIEYSWINGFPTGATSTINYYDFEIIKTGDGLFSVIGQQTNASGSFVAVPSPPTNASATLTGINSLKVEWNAPSSNGGSPIIDYLVSGVAGDTTITTSVSATFTITAGVDYSYNVKARNAVGFSNQSNQTDVVFVPVQTGSASQIAYTSGGVYTFIPPSGTYFVSVVCVGGGGGQPNDNFDEKYVGSGGGLGYKNNIAVTPGSSYTVQAGNGAGVPGAAPDNDSYFISKTLVLGGAGTTFSQTGRGTFVGDGGGLGGTAGFVNQNRTSCGGGGGAGGYAGNGGNAGTAAPAGGGGSGGNARSGANGYAGGGVGLLGQGTSGGSPTTVGLGGSGGNNGGVGTYGGFTADGGDFGGGGTGAFTGQGGYGGRGGVRIIWAGGSGLSRVFPSTNTGNL